MVGYLPEYRIGQFNADAATNLTDLILFSAEPTPEGGLDLGALGRARWEPFQELRSGRGVRLHLAIGGWGRSRHFARVALSEERRQAFAGAVLQACRDRELDGVDLDWEHPSNAAEEAGYGQLLEVLHKELSPSRRTVSVTVAGWQKLTPLAIRSADFVQLMAYDQPGAHATFEGMLADTRKLDALGVPRGKRVLGLPFYGRHRTQRENTLTYGEIVSRFAPLPTADEVMGLAFNGPETIRRKVALARDEGYAGVMIWEIGQDAAGPASLLRVINEEGNGPASTLMAVGRKVAAQGFQTLSQQLMGAMARGGATNAIEFCSTRAMPLTLGVGTSNRVVLQRVSHAPRNPGNAADASEAALVMRFQEEFRRSSNAPASGPYPAPLIRTNASGKPVFYAPIVLGNPLCLQCHGSTGTDIAPPTLELLRRKYPGDKATGFRPGDVRGLWKVGLTEEP